MSTIVMMESKPVIKNMDDDDDEVETHKMPSLYESGPFMDELKVARRRACIYYMYYLEGGGGGGGGGGSSMSENSGILGQLSKCI